MIGLKTILVRGFIWPETTVDGCGHMSLGTELMEGASDYFSL
jgi:hypothetical protein